jgi:prophage antirepressor-like protein
MKELILSQGETVIVDDEDYERLKDYTWSSNKQLGKCYPVRWEGNKPVRLSREILQVHDKKIFFANGDNLDFRKDNLTTTRISKQRAVRGWGASKYKGVIRRSDKWEAIIYVDKKARSLGYYVSEEAAARAYDAAALQYLEKNVPLNFPRDDSSDSIIPFNYSGKQIRVITTSDNEPMWVAKDVCDILGLDNVAKALNRVPSNHKGVNPIHTLGGTQKMTVVDEPGLYRLILRSDRPEAEPFMEWVTASVLPSIRKTGGYVPSFIAMEEELSAAIKMFLTLGHKESQAKELAIKALKKFTGVDPTAMFTAPEELLSAMDIAKELNMQRNKVNKLLTALNLQTVVHHGKDGGKAYVVTETGKQFCSHVKNPLVYENGYPNKHILWKPTLITYLKELLP